LLRQLAERELQIPRDERALGREALGGLPELSRHVHDVPEHRGFRCYEMAAQESNRSQPEVRPSDSKQGEDMAEAKTKYETIDAYIATFPKEVQVLLEKMRQTIKGAAPEAQEAISYQMPTFKLNGNLVHFAAFKHHIGLYPTPSGTEAFKDELAPYESGKGSIKFPMDAPIPFDLVKRVVEFRVRENMEKGKKPSPVRKSKTVEKK